MVGEHHQKVILFGLTTIIGRKHVLIGMPLITLAGFMVWIGKKTNIAVGLLLTNFLSNIFELNE